VKIETIGKDGFTPEVLLAQATDMCKAENWKEVVISFSTEKGVYGNATTKMSDSKFLYHIKRLEMRAERDIHFGDER
jgi:hypothetical protein